MSLKNALAEAVATATSDTCYQVVASYSATPPYHVVEVVDQENVHHFRGASGNKTTTVAIESFGATPVIADTKADLIETALDAVGQSIGTGGDATRITAFQTGRTDVLYSPQDASRGFVYSVRQTFDVWHPN
jgi:hypothetical protein